MPWCVIWRILKRTVGALTLCITVSCCGSGTGHTPATARTAVSVSASASSILAAARAAADSASSVHMIATTLRKGKAVSRVDATLVAGRGGVARVASTRGSFGFATVGGVSYTLVTRALLNAIPTREAQVLERAHGVGRWTRFPLASIPKVAGVTDFHGVVNRSLAAFRGVRKSTARIRGGPRVSVLTDSTGTLTLFVAATGKPYPLEIVQSSGGRNYSIITFDRWNARVYLTTSHGSISTR